MAARRQTVRITGHGTRQRQLPEFQLQKVHFFQTLLYKTNKFGAPTLYIIAAPLLLITVGVGVRRIVAACSASVQPPASRPLFASGPRLEF